MVVPMATTTRCCLSAVVVVKWDFACEMSRTLGWCTVWLELHSVAKGLGGLWSYCAMELLCYGATEPQS